MTRPDLSDVDFSVTAIVNNPPTVTIAAPAENQILNIAETVNLSGSANDIEDGVLTPSLAWDSNIDGSIGSGGMPSAMFSLGYHTVTASVMDSMSESGSDIVHLVVQDEAGGCPANLVVVLNPPAGASTYKAAQRVTLDGILSGATSDVTVKAGQSIVLNDGTSFEGAFAAILTPTSCD